MNDRVKHEIDLALDGIKSHAGKILTFKKLVSPFIGAMTGKKFKEFFPDIDTISYEEINNRINKTIQLGCSDLHSLLTKSINYILKK